MGAFLVLLLAIFAYYFVRLIAFFLTPLFALISGSASSSTGNVPLNSNSIPTTQTKQEQVVLNEVD